MAVRSKAVNTAESKVVRENPAAEFRKAVKAAGATYEINRDRSSYSDAMSISFADGRTLHLRPIPAEWSDHIDTLEAFIADPSSRRFIDCKDGSFDVCG